MQSFDASAVAAVDYTPKFRVPTTATADSAEARHRLQMMASQLRLANEHLLQNDRRITMSARATGTGGRLMATPALARAVAIHFLQRR